MLEHDADGLTFIEKIKTALVESFEEITPEEASKRVEEWSRLCNQPIVGNNMIYHESPVYWAKTIYYGRRDWWRDHPDEHHSASSPAREGETVRDVPLKSTEDLIDFHINRFKAMVESCSTSMPECESCVAETVEIAALEKLKKSGVTRINYNVFYASVEPVIKRTLEVAGHDVSDWTK